MGTGTDFYRTLLSGHGVRPTAQRLFIASFMLRKKQHLSAEHVFSNIGSMANGKRLARATVYNTLNLFTDKGLLRQVDVGDNKAYFDSNISAHHHFYNVTTGELIDIPAEQALCKLPPLPDNTELDSVCICVNIVPSRQ